MQALDDWIAKATGITCHSAKVHPGYIFVAIRGRTADGNSFAPAAAAKGAIVVVSDAPGTLPALTIPVIIVPDARLALAKIAAEFYNNPSHKLRLIGITGSNGKTTIACMLEHIFTQAGLHTGLIGTVRVNTGKISFPSTLTTPDAVSIQQYLAQMLRNKVTHAAMEVSAQGVDMQRVAHVRFSAGILTNICADHLDFHGNFANYLAAKAKFMDLLGTNTPLIVNVDDPYCQAIVSRFTGRLITAALENPAADISASATLLTSYSSTFSLKINRPIRDINGQLIPVGQHTVTLAILGRHNIENALFAAAAALLHGLAPETIIRALASFQSVERRMNTFHLGGLTVVDDTALNPGSIDAVFNTLATFRYNRLIVINAIRGQRGTAINSANAAALAGQRRKLAFELIITASSEQVDPANTVTSEEKLAFLTTLNTLAIEYTYTSTLPGAIKAALTHAVPGDLLVLIGAQGMDAGRQVLTDMIRYSENLYQDQAFYPQLAGK